MVINKIIYIVDLANGNLLRRLPHLKTYNIFGFLSGKQNKKGTLPHGIIHSANASRIYNIKTGEIIQEDKYWPKIGERTLFKLIPSPDNRYVVREIGLRIDYHGPFFNRKKLHKSLQKITREQFALLRDGSFVGYCSKPDACGIYQEHYECLFNALPNPIKTVIMNQVIKEN